MIIDDMEGLGEITPPNYIILLLLPVFFRFSVLGYKNRTIALIFNCSSLIDRSLVKTKEDTLTITQFILPCLSTIQQRPYPE